VGLDDGPPGKKSAAPTPKTEAEEGGGEATGGETSAGAGGAGNGTTQAPPEGEGAEGSEGETNKTKDGGSEGDQQDKNKTEGEGDQKDKNKTEEETGNKTGPVNPETHEIYGHSFDRYHHEHVDKVVDHFKKIEAESNDTKNDVDTNGTNGTNSTDGNGT